jgi:hypothetical protein
MDDHEKSTEFEYAPMWESIDKVVIGEGVTYLGHCAFESFKIKSITLSSTVEELGRSSISGNDITAVDFKNVAIIGQSAFYENKKLETVVIPSTVKSIGDYAFDLCEDLRSADTSGATSLASIGDTAKTQILYAGNRLGGDPLLDGRVQPSTSHVWADVVTDNHHVIESTSYDSSTWDAPLTAFGERTYDDAGSVGNIVNSRASGVSSLTAGGRWNNTHYSGVAFICAGYDIALANEYRGARLAMLMP